MDGALMLCNSLIKWLQSLGISGPQQNANEISDGVAISQALFQISPEYFNLSWISKIKTDVGNNWRLKVSNLKKIIEAIIEYYQDILSLNVLDSAKPDALKIGESADPMELGKLIQLVLGCAVHCEKKQEYITRIMQMEESVQRSIMQAIQSLEEATRGRGPFSMSIELADSARLQRLSADLEAANESRERLAQRCHELELQVECLMEEKTSIQNENQRLQSRFDEITDNYIQNEPGTSRTNDLRRQVDMLKEDLYKMETSRDDYRFKVTEYEAQIITLQARLEELQLAAEKATQLKDEVDALTESADKVKAMELTLTSYKKKLEEYTDLKKQIKILEEKNADYEQQIVNYDEDMKKTLLLKTQNEFYKKQNAELLQKLDDEIQKVDKVSFENKKMETKLMALQREREALTVERDRLRELNEELRCGTSKPINEGDDVARELAAPELRKRVALLEKENRSLRSANSANNESIADLDDILRQELLADANQRQEQLRNQLRASNQKILELEAKLEEFSNGDAFKQKFIALQESYNAKEAELQAVNDKHNKYKDKFKEIIQSMQTRTNTDEVLARADQTSIHIGTIKENEARLVSTAFLNLSEKCQIEAVDSRLAMLSVGQAATFLSQQRQPTLRRPLQSHRLK